MYYMLSQIGFWKQFLKILVKTSKTKNKQANSKIVIPVSAVSNSLPFNYCANQSKAQLFSL